jgi:cation diffusion facilitator family transporter
MEKSLLFKQGKKTTIVAALATILFAGAKAIVGFFSGSLVLIADAIHSAADSVSAFFVWLGLRIAQKKPTEKFPYGFYKVENITAFLVSLLILFAGYEIVKQAIERLSGAYQINIPLIAIGVALLDAIVMFSIGTYEIRTGKKINSQSLIADGRESRMHLFSSLMVLIGLFSAWFKISYLEGIMGILISLFIFKVGIDSAKDSIFALIDVSPSQKIEKKIKRILEKISGVRGFDNLKLRKSGPFIFGEVEIKIGKALNVKRAREISDNIGNEIKNKIKPIDSFTVAVSPYQTQKQKVCIPIEQDKGLDSVISLYFARASKFIFAELDNNKVKDFYIKNNPYKQKKVRAGLNVSDFVMEEKIDSIITKEMGPIAFHTLRDNIVDIYTGSDGKVKDIIREFNQGKLKSLKSPTRAKK